ncbi:hypothetical protein PHEL85_1963 [Polaribacter sp. Hel1_85]|nr:hypothetical protein PHEL85_1963 [Polaribacter sp. Hel1_85]
MHKKVLKQGGVEWKLLIEHPQDYYVADSGFARHLKSLNLLD